MNQEEKSELFDKKSKREYDKMRMDMEHDLSQRYHWEENRKQWEDNRKHLLFQKWVWVCTVLLGIFAVIYRDL